MKINEKKYRMLLLAQNIKHKNPIEMNEHLSNFFYVLNV